MKTTLNWLPIVGLLFILSGCGGGSTDNPTPQTDNPPEVILNVAGTLQLNVGDEQLFIASAVDDGAIQSYLWNNGSTQTSTTLSFDSAGEFSVWVEVTDNAGHTVRKTVSVTVVDEPPTHEPPVVQLTPAGPITLLVGETQQFSATVSGDEDVSYLWSPSGATNSATAITFPETGEFVVAVTVTNSDGLSTTKQVTVNVVAEDTPPSVAITPSGTIRLQTGSTQTFSATAVDDGKIVSTLWSDGSQSDSATITFDTAGSYTVSVTVTDDNGQSATASVTVIVEDEPQNNPPEVQITPTAPVTVQQNDTITFTASASDDGAISGYLWSNGATTQTTAITFDAVGEQSVSVTITDNNGLTAQAVVSVTVTGTPEPELVIYLNGAEFSSAPTIWAWIENGSSISEEMGYSWDEQQEMTLDPESGYYFWKMEPEYLKEVESGLNFAFKIDKTDEFSRNKSGCYSNNRWLNTLDECLHPPFMPYIGPYLTLITPEFADDANTATVLDPATHMVINYELQQTDSNFTAQAYFRIAGKPEWQTQDEDAVTEIGDNMGIVHHITLKNLTPNTRYEYKVTGPDGQFSKEYHFTTASTDMTYSRFLVIGDMQDEQAAQRWQDIAQTIASDYMDQFDFIITVGDMVKDDIEQSGDRFYWWKVFFDKGQELFAYKPMMPAMGNHDTPANTSAHANSNCSAGSDPFPAYCSNAQDTRSFRKYFYINPDMSYPDYYAYRYGSACFVSVNSEIPVFYGRYPELDNGNNATRQASWLSDKVNQHESCGWSLAYWHVPPINPAGGKDEVAYLRPYVDDFNGKLDWNITGHVHEYQRLKPVNATEYSLDFKEGYGRANDKGVGYLLTAPAGQWPRNYASGDMSQLAFYPNYPNSVVGYEIGFTIIQIEGSNFDMKTYGMGSVGDQVQPSGYRTNNDRTLQLLDSVSYSK